MKKIITLTVASVLAATTLFTSAPAANAGGTHRVVFKAWGIPRGMVDISAQNDIEMMRRLPYTQVNNLSGWDYTFADISVEDPIGTRTVGCAIYVDGRLKSRDVSDYGFAWCTI